MIFKINKGITQDVIVLRRYLSDSLKGHLAIALSSELYLEHLKELSNKSGDLLEIGEKVPNIWGFSVVEDKTLAANEFKFTNTGEYRG